MTNQPTQDRRTKPGRQVADAVGEAYSILRSAETTLLRGTTYKPSALRQWRTGIRWPESDWILKQMAINLREVAGRLEGLATELDTLAANYGSIDRARRTHAVNPGKGRFTRRPM